MNAFFIKKSQFLENDTYKTTKKAKFLFRFINKTMTNFDKISFFLLYIFKFLYFSVLDINDIQRSIQYKVEITSDNMECSI